MTLVLGIDPGLTGAFAIIDSDTRRIISIDDMPVWAQTINKKKRKRLDNLAAMDLFDTYRLMGVELCVLEAVGGRGQQSASAGFTFGYVVGSLVQMMIEREIMIETTPPGTWKKLMKVSGKKKATDEEIMQRAERMFPKDCGMFRGPKGGRMIDRAEAAMLARFGVEHVLRLVAEPDRPKDLDYVLAYRNADLGE